MSKGLPRDTFGVVHVNRCSASLARPHPLSLHVGYGLENTCLFPWWRVIFLRPGDGRVLHLSHGVGGLVMFSPVSRTTILTAGGPSMVRFVERVCSLFALEESLCRVRREHRRCCHLGSLSMDLMFWREAVAMYTW